jgi:hypothetical protein
MEGKRGGGRNYKGRRGRWRRKEQAWERREERSRRKEERKCDPKRKGKCEDKTRNRREEDRRKGTKKKRKIEGKGRYTEGTEIEMDECRRKRKGEEKERNVERTGRVIEQRGRKKKGKREREIEREAKRGVHCPRPSSQSQVYDDRFTQKGRNGERSKGEGIGKRIGEERTKRERWKERG